MSYFSRKTIIELINAMEVQVTSSFDRLLLEFNLGYEAPKTLGSKPKRLNSLADFLIKNPNKHGPKGSILALELIERELERRNIKSEIELTDNLPGLANSLKRDGFTISNERLSRTLPDEIPLTELEDELCILLKKYSFDTANRHLEQAINNHTRGGWAAANSQLRTFIESLFDGIYEFIHDGTTPKAHTSHERRQYLAQVNPPFLLEDLNEWDLNNHTGFIQGFWRRLHPEGSHPGLSDEEDCTFRLHLVILISHDLMKRLDKRIGSV